MHRITNTEQAQVSALSCEAPDVLRPRRIPLGNQAANNASVDIFEPRVSEYSDVEQGIHLGERSPSRKAADDLGRVLTLPGRFVGQTLASMLPLSVLADAMVFPLWPEGYPEEFLSENRKMLEKRFRGEAVQIPVRDYAVGRIANPGSTITLDGMYFEPLRKETKKTVIYCNPNAGVYETNSDIVEYYRNEIGVNLLVFNYRGVGESEGRPTTARTLNDMEDIYKWLVTEKGLCESDVMVHGRSLGGAYAAALAAKHPKMTLVCDRAFEDLASAAKGMAGGGVGGSVLGGLAFMFSASELSTHGYYQKVQGHKLCVADHHDEMFENYRGKGGDVIDLNSKKEFTHNRQELTLRSPLFERWVRENFLSK